MLTELCLFVWTAVNSCKEDFFGFLVVNEEQEWMIAKELRWFGWS